MNSKKIEALTMAGVLTAVLLITCIMSVSAGPIVIDEDSNGSWEDTFEDTGGIESWDNLDLNVEGLRITGIFEDDFTGEDGDLPDQDKWHILDDGQILEIESNNLRTEMYTVGSPTWGKELVRTRDDFSDQHVLTWRQNLLPPGAGAVYNFLMLNASDNSRIFGVNQNYANELWAVNFATGGSSLIGGALNGWFDHEVIYDNGYMEFYVGGSFEYSYTFNVASVRYEFGVLEQTCDARIFTDYVLITSGITSGNVTSTEIQIPAGQNWDTVTLNKAQDVPRNQILVSVLDGSTFLPIPGYQNLDATEIDISGIDRSTYPTLRLKASFSGDGLSTPVLKSWKVTWIDNIPPATPTGLTVINTWTGYSLSLVWNPNSEPDLRTYSLYSSTDNLIFNWIGDVTPDKLYFEHFGLTAGVTYYYKMTASDEVPNESPYSAVATGVPDTDMDGDGIGDLVDEDRDGDTVPNPIDDFPDNENEWSDTDGDGIGDNADDDDDDDGVPDQNDDFPKDENEWLDTDGDGIGDNADTDDDNDGVPDTEDAFPKDPKEWSDKDSDGVGDNSDIDIDGDGVLNDNDAFPYDPSEWSDTDGDGTGDNADTDDDGDGVADGEDEFPKDPKEWNDTDDDGIGDNEDMDIDGDEVLNSQDAFPFDDGEWSDIDADGVGDNADDDRDGDGFVNGADLFPDNSGEWEDFDDDGIGDNIDSDDDNDGHIDANDDYPYDASRWLRQEEWMIYVIIALILLIIIIVLNIVLIFKTRKTSEEEVEETKELPPPPAE